MSTSSPSLTLVHHPDYAGWVFDPHHPTQGRRFTLGRDRIHALAPRAGVTVREIPSDLLAGPDLLERVHTPGHVRRVLHHHRSGEWDGPRPDLARIAARMAGGTLLAARELLAGRTLTAVHLPGAKHHAQRDRSSGFCVFNDLALTATTLLADPHPATPLRRIAVLDIDAHHGDGTENLLAHHPGVLTFSVHDRSLFPGTGHHDDPARRVHNRPLHPGAGDTELHRAVADFLALTTRPGGFRPDLVMVAMGADGHRTDPLSTLGYTLGGLAGALAGVRRALPGTPLLLGGAGGYQPDDVTPEAWALMALSAATGLGADAVL